MMKLEKMVLTKYFLMCVVLFSCNDLKAADELSKKIESYTASLTRFNELLRVSPVKVVIPTSCYGSYVVSRSEVLNVAKRYTSKVIRYLNGINTSELAELVDYDNEINKALLSMSINGCVYGNGINVAEKRRCLYELYSTFIFK